MDGCFNLKEKRIGFCALEIFRTVFTQYVSMRSANKEVALEAVYVWLQPRLPFSFTTQLCTSLHINPYYCTSSLHNNALQWHTSLHWKTLYCTLALQTDALTLHTSLCRKTLWLQFFIVHTNALPLHTLYTITIGTSKITMGCHTRIGNDST
jgi:hypothetical protein